jgi:hypothetical protein
VQPIANAIPPNRENFANAFISILQKLFLPLT